MKRILLYFFIVLAISSCDQQSGSGNVVTEKRQTGNFTGIKVGGAFEVEIKTGSAFEVVVEADDNVIKYIETDVSGNVLDITTKSGTSFNNAHFKVYITAPEINSINSSGAADVKAKDRLKSNGKISLDASGASGIEASVDAPEVTVEVSSAAHIDLSGKTRDYKAEVSSAGNLKSGDLKSENTDVKVSSAGNAWVHASVSLKADASGAGNIYYKGGGNVVVNTSSAGNVTKED